MFELNFKFKFIFNYAFNFEFKFIFKYEFNFVSFIILVNQLYSIYNYVNAKEIQQKCQHRYQIFPWVSPKVPVLLVFVPLNTIIIYVWAMNRGTKLLGLRYTCRKENRLQCSESITARQTRFRTLRWIIDPWPNFRTRPKTIPDPNWATQSKLENSSGPGRTDRRHV